MRCVLIMLLLLYRRFLSPYLGGGCRFRPSCSLYALLSVRRFGAIAGLRLTIRRLQRCQAADAGGYDPVPKITDKRCPKFVR